MASITRKSEKTVGTVSASARRITVSVTEKLTIEESKELRALLREAEKEAGRQYGYIEGLIHDRFLRL